MTVRFRGEAAKMKNEQHGTFFLMIGLMLFFYAIYLGTHTLFVMGITPQQIGGDSSFTAYNALFLIAMMIFRAGGTSIIDRLQKPPDEPPDPPKE